METLVNVDREAFRNKYRDDGQRLHNLLADILCGTSVDGHTYSPEERYWVDEIVKWIEFYFVSLDEGQAYVENTLPIGEAFGCPDDLWGTPDFYVISPREVLIADAKFGAEEVEVENNLQVILYAIGIAQVLGWPELPYRLAILQPRSSRVVKVTTLTPVELKDWQARIAPRVRAAIKPHAPLVPNDEGCLYCDGAAYCIALAERMRLIQERMFAAPPNLLPVEELAEILKARGTIRTYLDKIEDRAKQLLELGQKVPGWKRVRGSGRRAWRDEQEALTALELLCPREDLVELKSPAQLEALFRLPRRALDALAPMSEGSPRLAEADDRREELPPVFEKEK